MDFCSDLTPEQRRRFYEAVLRQANRADMFSHVNGMRMTGIDGGRAAAELAVTADSLNPWGMVHGGCLCTLADTAAGALVLANGRRAVTLSCSLNYLRPAKGPVIRCAAVLRKLGRSTSVVDVSLTDQGGREVACGTYTFFNTGEVTAREVEEMLSPGQGQRPHAGDGK